MTPPQTATIITLSPITWSSGAVFSGYLQIGTAPPVDSSGNQYPQVNLWGTPQQLPEWEIVPIIQGALDTNTTIFQSSQIDPPNTQYVAYWFDNTWKQIYPPKGTPPAFFTISTTPYVITQPTLTVPGAASGAFTPAPQDSTSTSTPQTNYATPGEYILTGTADGTNTVFTIPYTPRVTAFLFIDGQKQDPSTYTRVLSTVTFNTAPTFGASITALVV